MRLLDRYVRDAPRRIQALQERACAERLQLRPEHFDRTAESLVRVWEWLVQHVNLKLPPEFPLPDPWWLPDDPSSAPDPDLAEWSDRISLYVAACFKTAFPDRGIRWRRCTEAGVEPALVNQPALSGFRTPFCPRLLVYDLARKVPQGVHAGRTLFDAFQLWSDGISPKRVGVSPANE
jgi:hypothetical protein